MKRIMYAITIFSIISLLFNGCTSINTPPSADSVKTAFLSKKDDIIIVINYMIDSGYNDIQIRNASGMIWADFEDVQITDASVITALCNLFETYKFISKDGMTITLLQWTAPVRDIGCGLCYSLLPSTLPKVEYATEMIKITESGWYYYVSDYEEWRRTGDGSLS